MTERKKRTTNKDAFDQGFIFGYIEYEKMVMDTISTMLEEYDNVMSQYPRNTKFVEIEVEAIKELREKLLYNKQYDDKHAEIKKR